MTRKIVPINYTSRDFNSIKQDLVNHAKRYYSDTFKDFNEASFGGLMLDTVAYVGDVLSFYLDYQANESFLETAIEYNNIIKLGRQLGYKFNDSFTSFGTLALYVSVPANATGLGPDPRYIPVLKRGAAFNSVDGVGFILNENVDFSDPDNEVVVATVNANSGIPTAYAIRAYGQIISGEVNSETISVGAYKKFNRIPLDNQNIVEILSVFDSEGHQYFEVDYLSQNTIYVEVDNFSDDTNSVQTTLKPAIVPRRFTVEKDRGRTFLQFGYGSEENLQTNLIADPSNITIDMHGKNYISDPTFDPSKLTKTDKMGIAPANTTLLVSYRSNTSADTNAAASSIRSVSKKSFNFPQLVNNTSYNAASVNDVVDSLEVFNPTPVVGNVEIPDSTELKNRIFGHFAAQNRAVTKQDYASLAYSMPARLGGIKRCNIVQDKDSLKRNLNMYIVSQNKDGSLVQTNSSIKNNLKSWISRYKMINDTIDILDAYIVNIGIEFVAVADRNTSEFAVLQNATNVLKDVYSNRVFEIGETFYITDVYSILRDAQGLLDVVDVKITTKSGGSYSSTPFRIENHMNHDGRYFTIPDNVILEIKFPNRDIKGTIR